MFHIEPTNVINVKPHFHDDDTGLGFESLFSLYVNKHPASNNRVIKFTLYSETTHYVGSKTAVNHIMTLTLVNQYDMYDVYLASGYSLDIS